MLASSSATWQAVRITEAWCHLSHVANYGGELSLRALQCVLEWFKSSSIEWKALLVVDSSLREIFEIQKEVHYGVASAADARIRLRGLLECISSAVGEAHLDPVYGIGGGYEGLGLTRPAGLEAMTVVGRVSCIDVAAIGVFLKDNSRGVDLKTLQSAVFGSVHQEVTRLLNL